MSTSIIPQLIKKDFMITRKMILAFCLVSLASIGVTSLLFGRIPQWALVNISFILLLSPAATCGMVLLMTTIVFEKERSTQAFIMSLPVTVKEFVQAKLLLNISIFTAFWLAVSAVAGYFSFARGLFPLGTAPFMLMIFLGVFVAYIGILCVSLWRQSLGWTVLAIGLFEMGTSGYLWVIAYLDPVASHLGGPEMVWNSTAISIVVVQVLIAISMILSILYFQSRKRDFI